jgi:prolipoprotein diacylglyceryltransferase
MFHLYGLFILLGLLSSLILIYIDKKRIKKYNLTFDQILDITICGLTGAIAGARLWFLFFDFNYNINACWYNFTEGLSLLGGLYGGIGGIYLYGKFINLSAVNIFNFIYPYAPLINSFGRIGCLMALCCGPFQIISSIYYFFIFIIFYKYKNKFDTLNYPFLYYIYAVLIERLLFDPLREDAYFITPYITYYQLISLFLILIIFLTSKWVRVILKK